MALTGQSKITKINLLQNYIYIYKEDRLCLSLSLSVSMHSHSFQATKFKLHRNVKDSSGQVVEGLDDSTVPPRGQKWRVNHSKNVEFDVHSHSFQDEELKLNTNVDDSPGQVVEELTFLPFPQRGQK